MSVNSKTSSLSDKAYTGLFWQGIGFSLSTLLSVAHIVIMARLLSPEVFGQFAVASIIIALTSIVSEFGLAPALVQKTDLNRQDISFVFLANILIGVISFALIFLFAENISIALNSSITATMIQVLALTLIFKPVGLASHALLLKNMNFHRIFIATNLSYFLGMLVVGVTLAWVGYGIWALIFGFIATSAIISLYYLIASPIRLSLKFNYKDSHNLLKYGIGLTSVQAVNQFSLMADKLILNQLSSSTFLGLYERSQRIQQMPGVFIGGVLDTVMFTVLSKLKEKKQIMADHFFNSVMIVSLIGTYLSVLIFTFSDFIVHIMLGEQWAEASSVLKLLSLLIGIQMISRMCDTYVRSTGVFRKSIAVKLIYLATVFAFTYAGYQLFQLHGVLVAIVAASGLHSLMMLLVCQRHSHYPMSELAYRFMPSIVLLLLLATKNILITQLTGHTIFVQIASILLSDAIVITVLLSVPLLIGRKNNSYIRVRIGELFNLVKTRLKT